MFGRASFFFNGPLNGNTHPPGRPYTPFCAVVTDRGGLVSEDRMRLQSVFISVDELRRTCVRVHVGG